MLLAIKYKALIIRIITSKSGILTPLLLCTVVLSGQVTNGEFLRNDHACLDDDPIAITEVNILQNDTNNGFSPEHDFKIELDPTFPSKYGLSSISRIPSELNPTFGRLLYDTVMVRYEYNNSENKLDSVRYIVTDNLNQQKDSAYVIFDIGCKSRNSPDRITCDPDKIIPTIPNTCYAEYTIPAPTYQNDILPNSTSSFSTYRATLGEYNIGSTVRLDTGKYDRFIAFGGLWNDNRADRDACETYLEVQDLQNPEIICPEDISSCNSIVRWDLPTYSDNCKVLDLKQTLGPSANTVFPIGTTSIQYKVTDHTGLEASCSFDVEVIAPSNLIWKNDKNSSEICFNGNEIDLNAYLNTPTIGSWSNNVTNGLFTPSLFSTNTTETVTFSYIENGCPQSLDYNLTILPVPDFELEPIPNTICVYTPNIILKDQFNTSSTGTWIIDDTEISNFTPSDYDLGFHGLSYSNNDSICPYTFNQNVKITEVETGDNIQLYHCGKQGEIAMNLSDNDHIINLNPELLLYPAINKINYKVNDYDSYNFKVASISNFSCTTVNSYSINIFDNSEEASAGEDLFLNYDDNLFTLNASPLLQSNGEWLFDASAITLEEKNNAITNGSIHKVGRHQLIWKVTSGVNCNRSYDTLEITKKDLIIPNSFTPNDDGVNDYLIIDKDRKPSSIIQIEIINQWGQILYQDNDYNNDWDGTLNNGNKIAVDTYYLNVAYNGMVWRETLYIKY